MYYNSHQWKGLSDIVYLYRFLLEQFNTELWQNEKK